MEFRFKGKKNRQSVSILSSGFFDTIRANYLVGSFQAMVDLCNKVREEKVLFCTIESEGKESSGKTYTIFFSGKEELVEDCLAFLQEASSFAKELDNQDDVR